MLVVFLIMLLITFLISILWVRGIDSMPKDYKGEDFLDWDDNKTNSEGDF